MIIRPRITLLTLACLLPANPAHAANLFFVAPTTWERGVTADSTYQEWDVFASVDSAAPTNSPDQGTFSNPALPALHDVYDTSGASFLTGGGNIYSPVAAIDVDIVVPNYNRGAAGWTTVMLQTTTLGSFMDPSTVRVVVDGTTHHAVDQALMRTVVLGGFGGNLEDRWLEFKLPGNRDSYTFEFNGAESSVSLDRVAVDTVWTPSETAIDAPNPIDIPAAAIVNRQLFYDNSRFDTVAPASNDNAIVPGKTALLPGGTATSANYTSYNSGINGIMIDVDSLAQPANIGVGDFTFRVGNSNNLAQWSPATAPTVNLRAGEGEGGADRIELTWSNGDILKTWLQVTMLANADTGLAADDVFYFGNALGEVGDTTANALVNATDEIQIRAHPRNLVNPAPIDDLYDINRDGLVNATDQILARSNSTNVVTALRLITPPSEAGLMAPVPEPGTLGLLSCGLAALAVVVLRRRGKRVCR